jgi:sulfonate transport system ATP-binding protein
VNDFAGFATRAAGAGDFRTEKTGHRLDVTVLSKRFGALSVLEDVGFSVAPGEFLSIVGASGCGKSTLLRLILGLDTDYDGDIRVGGVSVEKPGIDRAIVFQEHRLLPWLTVERNVAVALRSLRLGAGVQRKKVHDLLRLVGLERFAQAYPAQLSGGMAQRVAIARALVSDPKLLLLDEPLGALDALTRLRLQDELKRIVAQEGITAVLVTHDVEEAIYLGNRVIVMQPNPGRIGEVVPIALDAARDRGDPALVHKRQEILSFLGVTAAA